ncbi:hypothetical protein [Rhizobium sp. AAP43]|uniref:hypothetical protein n=1 Tax=Rhizobium sp. AAP43 TaxID=1523420 RepID=UPI0006B8C8B8|nr:hypothetical protein [Rhizobium sp. AAP43]KPF43031.1 hypothetical protein IP76_14660 [Rhizobium sp. AAP43]
MRFLMAIVMAMANLAKGLWNGAEWCWRNSWGLLGFGGSPTVMPPKQLDLPDTDEVEIVRDTVRNQQRAIDAMLSTPARKVQAWAAALPEQRDTIPLSGLTDDQIDWLEIRLTDEQLEILAAEKSEHKVNAALAGIEDAILGVPSVPSHSMKKKSRPSIDISDRIHRFRFADAEHQPRQLH